MQRAISRNWAREERHVDNSRQSGRCGAPSNAGAGETRKARHTPCKRGKSTAVTEGVLVEGDLVSKGVLINWFGST